MKKILLLFTILFISVITTACINNFAIQELNNKAETYLNNGDTETAICRLKSSLELDDEIYQTHYNLAVAYNTIGNYKGSLEESKKVIELKPDLANAYYTMALAKEGLAFEILNKEEELTLDEIADFNNKAADAVETYNKYLVMNTNQEETEKINQKISEINGKIQEYSTIYETRNSEKNQKLQEELKTQPEENNNEDVNN
ncbi:MAG: hypothetical protein IJY61_01695 [Candidatus Gastranaerophilales bacterium]|nr:hypothetical protein [Candidatus Gastranaerophilales bacterium]